MLHAPTPPWSLGLVLERGYLPVSPMTSDCSPGGPWSLNGTSVAICGGLCLAQSCFFSSGSYLSPLYPLRPSANIVSVPRVSASDTFSERCWSWIPAFLPFPSLRTVLTLRSPKGPNSLPYLGAGKAWLPSFFPLHLLPSLFFHPPHACRQNLIHASKARSRCLLLDRDIIVCRFRGHWVVLRVG